MLFQLPQQPFGRFQLNSTGHQLHEILSQHQQTAAISMQIHSRSQDSRKVEDGRILKHTQLRKTSLKSMQLWLVSLYLDFQGLAPGGIAEPAKILSCGYRTTLSEPCLWGLGSSQELQCFKCEV